MKKYISLILFLPGCIFSQSRYDVVIDEIMVDPNPSIGLPNNEWLELKNVSTLPVNLLNWRIADATGLSGSLPAYILQPDSFVVICPSNSLLIMNSFGPAIAVSNFPSLDNEGDLLSIRTSNGMT